MSCALCRYWRKSARLHYGHCFAPLKWGRPEPFWLDHYREQEQRYALPYAPPESIWMLTHPTHGTECEARRDWSA